MRDWQTQKLALASLLIAISISIPLFSPLRIVLEPASFTLASHVAIFIAMMISPGVAVAVAIGAALGFFFSFPLVVALRAASHVGFALVGGLYLAQRPDTLEHPLTARIFSFLIACLHAACEVSVVSIFYFGGGMSGAYYQQGLLRSVLWLVGVGSVAHSMVDFEIALFLYKILRLQRFFSKNT
jgi:niacin transporter